MEIWSWAGVFLGRFTPAHPARSPTEGGRVMSEDIPVFKVTRDAQGYAQFTCPRCGKTNRHGRNDGHRISHCDCWPGGYVLQTADLSDDPIDLAASQLETAARLLRKHRERRLDSVTWRVADVLVELGALGDDLPDVHRPTGLVALVTTAGGNA